VVKDVPANSTVVGVPGRTVIKDKEVSEQQQKRHAQAKKMGFDAYGVTRDAPDPVAHAINCILDHTHAIDNRIEAMCRALQSMNTEFDEKTLPELEPCGISAIDEAVVEEAQEADKSMKE